MSLSSKLAQTVAAAALASAIFTAAAFVASPSQASLALLDGFQISYGGVFDQWLSFSEDNEGAIHHHIGVVPAGFADGQRWISA